MNQIKIRPATLNDVPEINDILNNAILNTAAATVSAGNWNRSTKLKIGLRLIPMKAIL